MTREPSQTAKQQAQCNLSNIYGAAKTAIAVASPKSSAAGIDPDLIRAHMDEISMAVARIRTNDLTDLEQSLWTQIQVLEKQFLTWSEKSAQLTAVDFAMAEKAFNMAMKSQKALRQTIATLNEMKNPKRATFIRRQQNNLLYQAQPDQVQPDADVDVRSQFPQSTSQEWNHASMDAGSQSEAIPTDTPVATVEAKHRPAPTV